MNKCYVFYPPSNPQFFFPKKEFGSFKKYYSPYSLKSKLFWSVFCKSRFIRSMFSTKEGDIPIPVETISRHLKINKDGFIWFFNLGTKGAEQKATIIAFAKNRKMFLKFAHKQKARELIKNEVEVLKELQEYKLLRVPKLLNHFSNKEFTLLVSEVLSGEKMTTKTLSEKVINRLLEIPKVRPIVSDDEITTFAHGDFCPWNMLLENNTGELLLIDWEMAGYQPLGYDLFTFLFQTSFLLNPDVSPQQIININRHKIEAFFKNFNVIEWNDYLYKFATLRVESEESKENSSLLAKYKQLLFLNE